MLKRIGIKKPIGCFRTWGEIVAEATQQAGGEGRDANASDSLLLASRLLAHLSLSNGYFFGHFGHVNFIL